MTSISPAFSTKNGTLVWPLSINTSPRVIGRITPCEAIRAICAELNTGNMSAAFAAPESSVERAVSVTDPLVGGRRRFRRGLSEPGFEACLAEPSVITRKERSLAYLNGVVTRVRVSDNHARILECG